MRRLFRLQRNASNSLALASLCQSYHSVICHELAHVETDECGGPEFFSNGSKLLPASGKDGKLTPAAMLEVITRRNDIHYPKPRVVTLTQATEVGTVYRPEEIADISELAHRHGLRVHMDGARFANAAAALGASPADLSWRAGVDVLCFGGTKMGLPVGEAILFFNRTLSEDFAWRCKQAGQLASKMRFLSAPWLGILENGNWLRHATHANEMAKRLARGLAEISGTQLLFPVEANSVFVSLPTAMLENLAYRLALLHIHRRRRRTLHVRLGHDSGKCRCVAGRSEETLAPAGLISPVSLRKKRSEASRPDETRQCKQGHEQQPQQQCPPDQTHRALHEIRVGLVADGITNRFTRRCAAGFHDRHAQAHSKSARAARLDNPGSISQRRFHSFPSLRLPAVNCVLEIPDDSETGSGQAGRQPVDHGKGLPGKAAENLRLAPGTLSPLTRKKSSGAIEHGTARPGQHHEANQHREDMMMGRSKRFLNGQPGNFPGRPFLCGTATPFG